MPVNPVAPSAVPDFPALSDRANYNSKAYAWAQHMDLTFPGQMHALAVTAYQNAVEVAGNTSLAVSSAAAAQASEVAAGTYAGASRWVSGGNYTVGQVRWSPITQLLYRCLAAVNGSTTDPSADSGNWTSAIILSVAAGGTGASTAAGARTNLGAAVVGDRNNYVTTGATSQVAGQLGWKNFGNGHTIFDASAGTTPTGTACNKFNSAVQWGENLPILMGFNGTTTHGVRVDSARWADNAGVLVPTNDYTIKSTLFFSAGSGSGYIRSDHAQWGFVYRPSVDGAWGSHIWTNSVGGELAHLDNSGRFHATAYYGALYGNADTATKAGALGGGGVGGVAMTFNYSGQPGQPAWVWGGNDGVNMLVWNPAAFSVTYAASAGTAGSAGYAASSGTANYISPAQVGAAIVGMNVYDLGSYVMAKNFTGTAQGVGAIVSGGSLQAADGTGGASGATLPGTWRQNSWSGSLGVSLWVRIA